MDSLKSSDIRWKQRLENFESALTQLLSGTELSATRPLSDLEKQGLIQGFEFTHELAWNLMKDYASYQGGGMPVTGSRDATRDAFSRGILSDETIWMSMIQSRNLSSHTYNKKVAEEIVKNIIEQYANSLKKFFAFMRELAKK